MAKSAVHTDLIGATVKPNEQAIGKPPYDPQFTWKAKPNLMGDYRATIRGVYQSQDKDRGLYFLLQGPFGELFEVNFSWVEVLV